MDDGTAYYAFDHGVVRCEVLDTVNPHGARPGSPDATRDVILLVDWPRP